MNKGVAIPVIVLFLIATQGCFENSSKETLKEYHLHIVTDVNNTYEIIVPSVINDNGQESSIANQIEKEYVNRSNTSYGKALQFQLQGNFSIQKKSEKYESGKLMFSMREIKEVNHKPTLFVWIYYNGTSSISISMRCYTKQSGEISSHHLEQCENVLIEHTGWFQIEFQSKGGGD